MSAMSHWSWLFGMAMGGAIAFSTNCALAQVIPDGTLPNNSIVTSQGSTSRIDGGTQAGSNLFHSFQQFSVPTGGTAFFNNGADIQNIISRVTGGSVSDIDGLIRANGTANLFLINPSGIIFGRNASLNIGGSFLASTASAVKFADGTQFSVTAPQTTPLLTISVPVGLQYGDTNGWILNQSKVYDRTSKSYGLAVQPGKTLALVGGNVRLDNGALTALGGRVELGGVASSGTVDLSVDGNALRLSFPNGVERADVSLTQNSIIWVNSLTQSIQRIRGVDSYFVEEPVTSAGSIAINARNINIIKSGLTASAYSGNRIKIKAGEIILNASEAISFIDGRALADGVNGAIKMQGRSISLSDVSYLSTNDLGGTSGSIFLQADDSISIARSSILSNFSFGQSGGEINFKAKSIDITDGTQINTFGYGNTSVSGKIIINGSSSVSISNSRLIVTGGGTGKGEGGNVNLRAGSLFLNDGARIEASARDGNSGNIAVSADLITMSGVDLFGRSSGLFTDTIGSGQGGDIRIDTDTLRVLDKAVVNVGTSSTGRGGNITINTKNLDVTGGAQILATSSSSGQAGDITVNATDKINISGIDPNYFARSSRLIDYGLGRPYPFPVDTISPESGLFVRVTGDQTADAGNIKVTARSILLDNQGTISANTTAGQGSINLHSNDILLLRNNSSITSNAAGRNTIGGNINIETDFLIARDNSDISANSANFRGGNVRINAFGIFGTQFRDVASDKTSDITATGVSREFSGTVDINTLDLDPNSGLINLSSIPVNTEVAQGCSSPSSAQSSFVITGRGGLPPSPKEVLTSDAVWVDLEVTRNPEIEPSSKTNIAPNPTSPAPTPIVEATGWAFGPKAEVILTAQALPLQQNSWQPSPKCHEG